MRYPTSAMREKTCRIALSLSQRLIIESAGDETPHPDQRPAHLFQESLGDSDLLFYLVAKS